MAKVCIISIRMTALSPPPGVTMTRTLVKLIEEFLKDQRPGVAYE